MEDDFDALHGISKALDVLEVADHDLEVRPAIQLCFRLGFRSGQSLEPVTAGQNFKTKQLLFLMRLERHMTAEASALEDLLEDVRQEDGGIEAIHTWLDRLSTDNDRALLSAELQRQARRAPAFAGIYAGSLATHRDSLARLIEALFSLSGRKLPLGSQAIADAFMALSHGLAVQRASPHAGADPAGSIIRVFLGALLQSAPRLEP